MPRRVLCLLAALALCVVLPVCAEESGTAAEGWPGLEGSETGGTLGLEMTAFGEEDLHFSGFFYPELQPETLPGIPEKVIIDNGDGSYVMCCVEEGWEAVFACDAEGGNARILSFTLLDDSMEGPRGVRIGDQFHEDFQRFRSGENEMTEDMTEVLYGTEDTVPRGLANYWPGEMTLRYVTETESGMQVELVLQYENTTLSDIVVRTVLE